MLSRLLRIIPLLVLPVTGASSAGFAVTAKKPARAPFLFDITSFTTSLALPVKDTIETIKMAPLQMRERAQRSVKDETVEPLTLVVSDDPSSIKQLAAKIAADGSQAELAEYLRKQLRHAKPTKTGSTSKTVTIDSQAYDLIDQTAFSEQHARTHHKLTVATDELKNDHSLRRELMKQLSLYFSKADRQQLLAKIAKGQAIDIDTEMLPEFAKKMVGKYIIYRGPNCFHAALAFQSPELTSSSLINVKNETGYHRAMINYDELWRELNAEFYEVNADKTPLKYGDMLVFFDVPKEAEHDLETPVDFHWIRHAATYLFGGYTFSKGSKSPNTPYAVHTLAEEWKTWKRYSSNLGVKVYRRSQKRIKPAPPSDLSDWIY